jgi:hypothetical protein
MSWFWMNVPLAAVFFAAWSGIPLWMVLKHPGWGPAPADSRRGRAVDLEPVAVPGAAEYLVGARPTRTPAGSRR